MALTVCSQGQQGQHCLGQKILFVLLEAHWITKSEAKPQESEAVRSCTCRLPCGNVSVESLQTLICKIIFPTVARLSLFFFLNSIICLPGRRPWTVSYPFPSFMCRHTLALISNISDVATRFCGGSHHWEPLGCVWLSWVEWGSITSALLLTVLVAAEVGYVGCG